MNYNSMKTVDTAHPMRRLSQDPCSRDRTGTTVPRHLGDDQGKSDSALITVCVGPMLGLAALKSAQSL